jgi:putative ABC transport system ATP-binding protein
VSLSAGLDRLTSGEAIIGSKSLTNIKDKALTTLRRDKVGFIFQSFNLVPTLNAEENITLPITIAGKKTNKKWVTDLTNALGITDRLNHTPSELSGGQQQRVAAARALASKPDVIFADEPSGNLDSKSGNELLKFLRSAVDEHNQAIVMVTHDAKAASYADKVIFLDDGQIVDELAKPTVAKVLDKIKQLEG